MRNGMDSRSIPHVADFFAVIAILKQLGRPIVIVPEHMHLVAVGSFHDNAVPYFQYQKRRIRVSAAGLSGKRDILSIRFQFGKRYADPTFLSVSQ